MRHALVVLLGLLFASHASAETPTRKSAGVNDAPVMDVASHVAWGPQYNDVDFPPGPAGGARLLGLPISSFVDLATPAGQLDNVTDADVAEGDPSPGLGIAITFSVTGGSSGVFWYTTNGGASWQQVVGASGTSALLLADVPSNRLYYDPSNSYNGNITGVLAYRAWDQTSGVDGSFANVSSPGGSSAFSTAVAQVDVRVLLKPLAPRGFVASTTAPAAATSMNLVYAAGQGVVGDGMIATLAVRPWNVSVAPPAGWTLVARADQVNGDSSSLRTYYKRYGAGEGLTYTFSFSGVTLQGAAGGLMVYADVNAAMPVMNVSQQATPSSLTHATAAYPLIETPTLIMSSFAMASSATWTMAGGEAYDVASQAAGTGGVSIAHGISLLQGSSGWGLTLPAMSATASNDADFGVTQVVGLRSPQSNRAPRLDPAVSPALSAVVEDAGAPVGAVGTLVSSLIDFAAPAGQLDNVTDVNVPAQTGIAITAIEPGGTLYYSLDNGVNWLTSGPRSHTSALLLQANASTRLYFRPAANVSGTVAQAITFRAWDLSSDTVNGSVVSAAEHGNITQFSEFTDVASILVTPINDAPVLDASKTPVMTAVDEDAAVPSGAVGTLVSALVDPATPSGGLDNVSDLDGPQTGIAVTGLGAGGSWHYSIDGSTWQAMGNVSDSTARLLAPTARVYLQPTANTSGTSSITFRAWDASTGINGGTLAATPGGGTTAFSTAIDTAAIVVNPINDAPTLDASKSPVVATVNEDPGVPVGAVGSLVSDLVDFATPPGQIDNLGDIDSGALPGIAVVSVSAGNTGYYSLDGGASWQLIGTVDATSSRLLAADAATRIFLQPAPNATGGVAFLFRAWDRTSGSNGALAASTPNGGITAFSSSSDIANGAVTPVNDAPEISTTPATTANEAMAYTYDADATDVDGPGALTWTLDAAHTCGGTIDAASGVFSFTPASPDSPASCVAALRVCDDGIPQLCATQPTTITIMANAIPTSTAPAATSVLEDQTLAFTGVGALQVADADTPALTVDLATSSGTLSLSVSGLNFETGDGNNDALLRFSGTTAAINAALASLTLSPAADFYGAATLQFTVDDGIDAPQQRVVMVDVGAVNDAPTLDPIADGAPVLAGSGPRQRVLTGIGAGNGEPTQLLALSALSDAPAVIADPQIVYNSSAGTAQLTFTPLVPGTALITVLVVDDGGTANAGVDTRTRNFTQVVVSDGVFGNGFETIPD